MLLMGVFLQFFTGWMPFMPPNQQCQSTEGTRYPLTSNTLTCLVTKAHVCEVRSFPEDCLWVWRGLEYLGKHCQLTMVCVGLSPDLQSMEQIRRIMRPTDVPDQGLLCDLLWSDPDKETMGWGENDRGVSFTFGAEVVAKFLHKHDLDLICRAHQVCVLLISYDVRPVVVIRHTVHRCGLLLQMYVVWSVYLSVLVTAVSCAQMTESIKMLFGVWTWVGPRKSQNGMLLLMAAFTGMDIHCFAYRQTRKPSLWQKNLGFGDWWTLKNIGFSVGFGYCNSTKASECQRTVVSALLLLS